MKTIILNVRLENVFVSYKLRKYKLRFVFFFFLRSQSRSQYELLLTKY